MGFVTCIHVHVCNGCACAMIMIVLFFVIVFRSRERWKVELLSVIVSLLLSDYYHQHKDDKLV